MRCASALSTHPVPAHGVGEAIADLFEHDSSPPAFLAVFLKESAAGAAEDVANVVRHAIAPQDFLIVLCPSLLAAGTEVGRGPGLALWAVWADESINESVVGHSIFEGSASFASSTGTDANLRESFVLLVDPACEDIDRLLNALDSMRPRPSVTGGLLSSTSLHHCLIDAEGRTPDAYGIRFRSPMIQVLLGHGSQAISPPMTVTSIIGSMLCELDRSPALDRAKSALSLVPSLIHPNPAQDLAVAIVQVETDEVIDVVGVLGADSTTGAIALARPLPVGSHVAFHVLGQVNAEHVLTASFGGTPSSGALIFASELLNPQTELYGSAELGLLSEALGTSSYAGVHVASSIGDVQNRIDLIAAPLNAAIFGRMHH